MAGGREWHEELPENCPPKDAGEPSPEHHYRIVRSMPPTECDFISQKELYPHREFSVSQECRARAVSLFLSPKQPTELLKTGIVRGVGIVALKLPPEAGLTKTTNAKTGHVAWWRRADFDPVPFVCTNLLSQTGT